MNVLKILKKQGVGLGLTLISILIIIFFHRMHVFDNLEAKIYDLGFRVRGPLSGWASREPIPKKTEPFTDSNNNGLWDDGEQFTDSNENGKWDKGLDVVIVDLDQKSYENVPWSWPYTR
ncbi:MAG TPA: hypothetical protein EYM87_02890, partial [Candidatus Marinimicrobia bacterium]|nr:hypothetical protein [Candidatus Neomarinimicrobiota bacterium]